MKARNGNHSLTLKIEHLYQVFVCPQWPLKPPFKNKPKLWLAKEALRIGEPLAYVRSAKLVNLYSLPLPSPSGKLLPYITLFSHSLFWQPLGVSRQHSGLFQST
jgi:hypothetical protein